MSNEIPDPVEGDLILQFDRDGRLPTQIRTNPLPDPDKAGKDALALWTRYGGAGWARVAWAGECEGGGPHLDLCPGFDLKPPHPVEMLKDRVADALGRR